MKAPTESVRVSKQGREQLIKLKRQTGIENWNVLCRWALCCSLREKSVPLRVSAANEGGVEMSWKVFAGEFSDALAAVILKRSSIDGFLDSPDGPATCLRAHLHRGLGYLTSDKNTNDVSGFLARWLNIKYGGK